MTNHLYADDILIHATITNYNEITNCLTELYNWMTINYLHVNAYKITLINISHKLINFSLIYLHHITRLNT